VLPDDQRRSSGFQWPPPKANYVYGALQGAMVQAAILQRAGFPDVWTWQSSALRRAFDWLHVQAHYPADGDNTCLPSLANWAYGTAFPAPVPCAPGKNVAFMDWSHRAGAATPTTTTTTTTLPTTTTTRPPTTTTTVPTPTTTTTLPPVLPCCQCRMCVE
jgi:hypothetical protein